MGRSVKALCHFTKKSCGLIFHPGVEQLFSYLSDQNIKCHQDEHRKDQRRRQGDKPEQEVDADIWQYQGDAYNDQRAYQ
jgi:hypothetical protein